MKTDLSAVRSRVESSRSPGGRVPVEVRHEVLELVERARAAGANYRAIAKEIGVSFHTMMGWRQRAKKKSVVQRVRVMPIPHPSGSVVRGPRGLEVEGLTVSELAELWIRLG